MEGRGGRGWKGEGGGVGRDKEGVERVRGRGWKGEGGGLEGRGEGLEGRGEGLEGKGGEVGRERVKRAIVEQRVGVR